MQRLLFLLLSLSLFFLATPHAMGAPEKKASSSKESSASAPVFLPKADEKVHNEAVHLVKSDEEAKQETRDLVAIVKNASTALMQVYLELAEKEEQAAPWRKSWNEALERLKQAKINAELLHKNFVAKQDLLYTLANYKQQWNQLLPSLSTYKNWPNPMEAINSRISLLVRGIEKDFAPLYEILSQTEHLLEAIRQSASFSANFVNDDPEFVAYNKDIQATKTMLEQELVLQQKAIERIESFKKEIKEIQDGIVKELPVLWKKYYLAPPLSWLDSSTWQYLPQQLSIALRGLELRKSLEFPTGANEWRKAILRAFIGIILFSVLLFVISRQSWVPFHEPTVRHCFYVSLPMIALGICFLLSAFSPQGDNFRFFLALGNLCIIPGQILLAWDLRLFSQPSIPRQSNPLLRLYPLTFLAYILLYLPLLPVLVLSFWFLSLVAVLIWRRFWPKLNIGSFTLEKNIFSADTVVLWICLILTLLGLDIASMLFYLTFVSTSIAAQLCQGGIDRINYLNDNQPSDGIRAILANILISLAAPIIMLLTISSVLLWVMTLPGGTILIKEYLFKNFSIGSAEFNVVHILLIISVFFLTKTLASTGSRQINNLIANRSNGVDTTLIAPAQTAFTYLVWLLFALFVMHMLDIDFKNAAMVMTGLTVGIGMGLQSIVNNFFSGLLLIFGRMLQVGDVVEVGNVTGKVARISVRHTLVQTFDNAHIYIPNSEFISGHLVNWSRNDSTVRASVTVGVAYGTNTSLVVKTLEAVANKVDNILRYPEPTVAFQDFADSTLQFTIFFWVRKFADRAKACTDVRLEIEKQFTAKNIEIAFPQMDVHIDQTSAKKLVISRHEKRALPRRNARKNGHPVLLAKK